MNTYEVEVNKSSQGFVTVQAGSSDEAFEIARDAVNSGNYALAREQSSIRSIELAPDVIPEITADTPPEEVEEINALSSSKITLEQSIAAREININPVLSEIIQ